MITQGFVVDFFAKPVENIMDTKRKESINSRIHTNFNNTLKAAVDNSSLNKDYRGTKKSMNCGCRETVEKSVDTRSKAHDLRRDNKINSYKEAIEKNKQISSREKKENTIKEKDSASKIQETIVEESIAEILNISVEELNGILNTLNISIEDLADQAKTAEVAQKISDYFGLDSDQKTILTEIIGFVAKESKDLVSEISAKNIDRADWINFEGAEVEVVEADQKLPIDSVEFGKRLKDILSQLDNKLKSDEEGFFESISNKLEANNANNLKTLGIENEQKEVNNGIEATTFEENTEPLVSTTSTEASKSEEDSENTTKDDETQNNDLLETQKDYTLENNTKAIFRNGFGTIMNEQINMKEISQISDVKSEVYVSNKELITQIVEKAKATLTDEKSEMVIDLKPDHLGKLSLKVVTERGAVVAKFVAESEQVKAAIEANMDSLKQSLTKQGFSVQGFSVSVRQDSRRSFDQGNEHSKSSRSNKAEKIMSVVSAGVTGIEEKHEVINPYMVNTSSINLKA
jgi:flagellar hook-length control protein FliK